ncbi:MAG: ATP-binding cassette domain-containing protein [Petrimonas sp.]|uniref:ATP-binding cassette domain-containing protein n=1 Tax=Petrimonas sp. TaxID=2023866 RepID=UPI002B3B0235|nr:ATP-binding cassette domain-containing protein [Petrimonas sp.]MEA4996920.1 ATP-binding cassette domain-containing protein [Petrimonas sp.]MEA5043637.1 ATP-binding cassette domain-containing protein [Petrimonas sp.]
MKHTMEISGMRLLFDERLILSDVYMKIETGDTVGLLGRNGCGKTCLMRGVYGTLECEKSVIIDNISVYEAYKKPSLIRYLPQHHFIPKYLTLKRVFRDFAVDFERFTELFPIFQLRENTKIGHLSGGMHRLVELYVIIKSDAKFILLDEPFTHISPVQIETIQSIIDEERSCKGFLITDHLFKRIQESCNQVYLLLNGKTHNVENEDDLTKLGYIYFE